MSTDRSGPLRPAESLDPVQRLWEALPLLWRGPVIGPGIQDWESVTENGERGGGRLHGGMENPRHHDG
jgi:hypothetical protein